VRIKETCLEGSRLLAFSANDKLRAGESRMKKPGESKASGVLFWEMLLPHKHKLYNFIQKSLNFSEDANDVFQETVMRAFRYLYSYNKDKEFSTWLFAIAHNEVKKHFRKAKKFVFVENIERIKRGGPDNSHELVQEVYRFAERLKPKHREVFFLFYYNGFAISEISLVTGIKEGTVKGLLNRARNDLKKVFGDPHE